MGDGCCSALVADCKLTAATAVRAPAFWSHQRFFAAAAATAPCAPTRSYSLVLTTTTFVACRCFPKFPSNLTAALVSTASGVAKQLSNNSLVQDFANNWDSSSQKWGRYVGDISKGILVIVVGGLLGGLVLSLVGEDGSERGGWRGGARD